MICPNCAQDDMTLEAVCNVLVLKALEDIGRRVLRADRSRFKELPWEHCYRAHVLWTPDEVTVAKALKGAWDVIPALLDHSEFSKQVTKMLDDYVRDLAITGTEHTVEELRYRMRTRLYEEAAP